MVPLSVTNLLQYGLPLKVVSYKDLYGWTMDEIVKAIGLKTTVLFVEYFIVRSRCCINESRYKLLLAIMQVILLGIYSPNAYRGFARELIKDLERIRPRSILDIIRSGENFRIATCTKLPEQGICERCSYMSSQVLKPHLFIAQKIANVELLIAESNLTGQAQTIGNNDLKKQWKHGNSVPKITDSNFQSKQCGSVIVEKHRNSRSCTRCGISISSVPYVNLARSSHGPP
ncbi:hypothetical protein ZIOFF_016535 [Zingiber officinale]|uniref:Uncharacterized protein n=1 Tax=Zingiber officinale TaxID=94328 RepID=A0A8J5LQZ2_ZINOF|nr:hypothetical protein ZIOFF_016535 [Zingiber officinale]